MEQQQEGQNAAEKWANEQRHARTGEGGQRGAVNDEHPMALRAVARWPDAEQGALQYKVGSRKLLRSDAPCLAGYLLARRAGRSQAGLELAHLCTTVYTLSKKHV